MNAKRGGLLTVLEYVTVLKYHINGHIYRHIPCWGIVHDCFINLHCVFVMVWVLDKLYCFVWGSQWLNNRWLWESGPTCGVNINSLQNIPAGPFTQLQYHLSVVPDQLMFSACLLTSHRVTPPPLTGSRSLTLTRQEPGMETTGHRGGHCIPFHQIGWIDLGQANTHCPQTA